MLFSRAAFGDDRGDRVPVIRRGDDDGVDVAPRQQLAEIDERGAAGVGAGLARGGIGAMDARDGVLPANAMHIADGDDLHVLIAKEAVEMPAPHHADADEAEIDAIVGALSAAFLSADVRVENKWGRTCRDCGGEELATRLLAHGETAFLVRGLMVQYDLDPTEDILRLRVHSLSDKRIDCSLGGFARVSRETAKRASVTLVLIHSFPTCHFIPHRPRICKINPT